MSPACQIADSARAPIVFDALSAACRTCGYVRVLISGPPSVRGPYRAQLPLEGRALDGKQEFGNRAFVSRFRRGPGEVHGFGPECDGELAAVVGLLGGAGQAGHEAEPFRHLERGQPGLAVLRQFLRGGARPGPQDDGGVDFLAVDRSGTRRTWRPRRSNARTRRSPGQRSPKQSPSRTGRLSRCDWA